VHPGCVSGNREKIFSSSPAYVIPSADVNTHYHVSVLSEAIHGFATGSVMLGNRPEISPDLLGVQLHPTGCAKMEAMNKHDLGLPNLLLDFRTFQGSDILARAFPDCDHLCAKEWNQLIQDTRCADDMVEDSRLAEEVSHTWDRVHPTSSVWHRVLAVDILARCLEEFGIRMKGEVDDPMVLLFS